MPRRKAHQNTVEHLLNRLQSNTITPEEFRELQAMADRVSGYTPPAPDVFEPVLNPILRPTPIRSSVALVTSEVAEQAGLFVSAIRMRAKPRLSQYALASVLGVSVTTVNRVELGRGYPRPLFWRALAAYLDQAGHSAYARTAETYSLYRVPKGMYGPGRSR